jgi:hypothetical protein
MTLTGVWGAFRFFTRSLPWLTVFVTYLIRPPVGTPAEISMWVSARYPYGSGNACLW